ncbi:MAG: efflux RND transporter periplasmic adaptor subunit [Polyangiaceae bacterium]|nr:efflux RND transporter periplasmic adaptor subunit [Polyangiaceae bacterium]
MNKSRTRKWLWRVGILLVLVGIGFGVWKWRQAAQRANAPTFETEPVVKGELKATVTATGTLDGRDSVEVGAEVTGNISKIYVDFNDRVKAGDILLEINPETLIANKNSASARLSAARASYSSAKASAKEAKTTLKRTRELSKKGLVSTAELESAEAAAARADAQVRSTSADILVAKASVDSSDTALKKATIRSPIDGVVLSRSVELGQTVTASLQTPVLFLIARDLTKMELSVQIDEADIGRVKEGQDATFTVDAYPKREFKATLRSLRNVPTTTDNVVTYEAVLDVTNDDLSLRPGMTATAIITTEHVKDAVLVPNAALRFTPPAAKKSSGSARNPLMMGGPRGGRGMGKRSRGAGSAAPAGSAEPPEEDSETVWILEGRRPRPVKVKTGVSDGTSTEIKSGLEAGGEVVVDYVTSEEK